MAAPMTYDPLSIGIFIAGAAFAIKTIVPLIPRKNGNGLSTDQEIRIAEWRASVSEILKTQSITLSSLAESMNRLVTITTEIERRSRHQEEAINRVLAGAKPF